MSTIRGGDYTFFYVKGKENQVGKGICVYHRRVSAFKTVEFVSDRVSYIVLRGGWCNIIVLNVHARGEKSDDSKDSFYEELEKVFYHFHNSELRHIKKT